MPQSQRMSSEELIDLIRRGVRFGPGTALPRSEVIEMIAEVLENYAVPRAPGATTKHGGVELTTESANVWWVRDGRVVRVVFYLERPMALKAAGIDPDRLPGE